jgi:inosine-uridine nucleoside N-ribohydrolase
MSLRWWRRGAVAALALLLLALLSFALPVQSWRTGEIEAPPLSYEKAPSGPLRLWVDTDAACGTGRRRDPDDCLALLALLSRPGVELVGVSTVFGNADLDDTDAVTRELVQQSRRAGWADVPVYRGCASALHTCMAGPDAARGALIQAAAAGAVTYLALGPLTNLAAALRQAPWLAQRIDRVVAVMGRRPGHRFHPAEGRSRRGVLFGHGPVLRDLNVELDPDAVAGVLRSGIRLDLVPYTAARQWPFTPADVASLATSGPAGAWVAERSMDWLAFWADDVGLDGFYPFDLMAARFLLAPGRFACASVDTWLADDALLGLFDAPRSLLVAQGGGRPPGTPAGRARYCDRVVPADRPSLHGD